MNALDKARSLLRAHEQQVKQAVNKVGDLVDDKTKRKYHDTIEKVEQKAADLVDKVAGTAPGPDAPTAEPGTAAAPEAAKAEGAKPGAAEKAATEKPGAAKPTVPAEATQTTAAEPATTEEEDEEEGGKTVPPTAGTEPSTKADVAEAAAPAGVTNADVAAAEQPGQPERRAGEPGPAGSEGPSSGS